MQNPAMALASEMRVGFIEHLSGIVEPEGATAPEGIRIGTLDGRTSADVASGRKRDLRPLRMMTVSGKGGPGHEDTLNVTLFDHSLNVACGAMLLAARDLADEAEEDALRRIIATVAAVGFAHDIDKELGIAWDGVGVGDCAAFIERWGLSRWLSSNGVAVTPEQFHSLVKAVETRTAVASPAKGIPGYLFNACRLYVRAADRLEGTFLRAWMSNDHGSVCKAWNAVRGAMAHPASFDTYSPFIISDPHHPFLLDALQSMIGGACLAITGSGPLFNVLQDNTLISFLPDAERDRIISLATEDLKDSLPFETRLHIGSKLSVKLVGPAPGAGAVRELIRRMLLLDKGISLLSVKNADVSTNGSLDDRGQFVRRLASSAGCPAFDNPRTSATTPAVVRPKENSPELADVVTAASISFGLGVEVKSRNKTFSPDARMESVTAEYKIVLPDWASNADRVTRRTLVALAAAAAIREGRGKDPFAEGGCFRVLIEKGLFSDQSDKGDLVRKAVGEHVARLVSGVIGERAQGRNHCIVTGLPVDDTWLVSQPDGLHGLKSSAISYREGRSEDRLRERSDVHVSPVSYAEFRLRKEAESRKGRGEMKSVPVRLVSMTSQGMFGAAASRGGDIRDVATFDILRGDRANLTLSPLETYMGQVRIGRFEDLPARFVDRVGFFRRCMQSALRLGRPIHVFQGLPMPRPEFFVTDCFDPELRTLVGGTGLRIEQIRIAMRLLGVVEFIGRPRKEGGLNDVGLAKSFCMRRTRFEAACLAWWSAINDSDDKVSGSPYVGDLFNNIIPKEMERMEAEKETSVVVDLARLARSIQRAALSSDTNNRLTLLLRTAIEAAEATYKDGDRTEEGLVAAVAGMLAEETERAEKSSARFFSGSHTRPPKRTITDQIEEFATIFVRNVWLGRFHGRPATHNQKRVLLASYVFAFRRLPATSDASTVEAA